MAHAVSVTLLNVRICYTNGLHEPSAPKGSDAEPKYNCVILINKEDAQMLQINTAVMEAAKSLFGDKAGDVVKAIVGTDWMCVRDGDKHNDEAFKGHYFIRGKNKDKPELLGKDRKTMPESEVRHKFRSGNFANVVLKIGASNKGKNNIYAVLSAVQYHAEGAPLGGVDVSNLPVGSDEVSLSEGDTALVF